MPRWSCESIEVLLKHGSRVDHRDVRGRTCLHLVFFGSLLYGFDLSDMLECFCKLIRASADVYAICNEGLTPSHVACNRNFVYETGTWAEFGTWRDLYSPKLYQNSELQLREIWTQALGRCGYNAEEVMRQSVGEKIAKEGWYGCIGSVGHYYRRKLGSIGFDPTKLPDACPKHDDEFSESGCEDSDDSDTEVSENGIDEDLEGYNSHCENCIEGSNNHFKEGSEDKRRYDRNVRQDGNGPHVDGHLDPEKHYNNSFYRRGIANGSGPPNTDVIPSRRITLQDILN